MSIEARQARWHSLSSKNRLGCLLSCRTRLAVSKYLNNHFKELFFPVSRSLSLLTKSVQSEGDDAPTSLQRESRENLFCVHENVFSRACQSTDEIPLVKNLGAFDLVMVFFLLLRLTFLPMLIMLSACCAIISYPHIFRSST